MYFPYLHGMQKEMLALRQSIPLLAADACVQPVIEPVRHRLASMMHTLQACENEGLPVWMVVNPAQQEFAGVGAAPALSWGRHLMASIHPRRYLYPTLMLHAGVTVDVVRLFAQSYAGQVVGVVNLSQIVFTPSARHAYLAYHGMVAMAGRGLMTEAVGLAVGHAFGPIGLHRLEANIQPGNTRSLALVKRLGFRLEGFSPRYLRIDGEWRDHERWALLADESEARRSG